MQVFDLFDPFFAFDVVVDELHRAWTIKRADGDDVLDTADIKSLAAIRDATAFHLEDAECFAAIVDIECRTVVDRNGVDVEIRHLRVNEPHRLLHDCECAQAEEVHFEHAKVGEWAHGILGDDLVFLALAERDEFIQRAVADDHAGSMDARVAAQTLEHSGVVPELAHGCLVLDGRLQLRVLLTGLLEVDIQLVRDHLCHAVAVRVAPAQHAGDIADHALRAQCSEGDDLRHGSFAVFLAHILDHLAPALHAEVHIDIGRADALGVQEPLKNKPVAERVDIGDAQHIRDEGTSRRAAARAHGNTAVLRMADEIPDDQKIADEPGFLDHREFVVEALVQLGVGVHAPSEALAQSFMAEVAQVLLAAARVGRVEIRVFRFAEFHLEITPFGDAQRVVTRLGKLGEECAHFLGGFEIQLGTVAHAFFIHHVRPRADADEHIVGLVVGLLKEVDIIRGNQSEIQIAGEFYQLGIDPALGIQSEIVDFDEIIFRAENIPVDSRRRLRVVKASGLQKRGDFTLQASAQGDDPLRMRG